jgi:transcriptional regulator with XRE-family HTH domain
VISGDLIREARLRAGLTQRELATRAKTSQPAVARWESGDVVPSFERLANYDDSYDYFIDKRLQLDPDGRVRQALKEEEVYEEIRAAAGVARAF